MARSLVDILNESNPNKSDVALQQARVGSLLALGPIFIKAAVATGILTLPENARAAAILSAFATAGTTLGPKNIVVPAATASGVPATTNVTISPTGHISFNVATDALTAAEVLYIPEEGEIFEEIVPVVSNAATPLAGRNVKRLLEATLLAGTVTGTGIVDQRGFTVATTLHVAASATGAAVNFLSGDAVTSARIKYIATPGIGTQRGPLGTLLRAADKNW